ncbi:MAG: PAS domain S-box protein [Bacteriovoracia bacterium]
MNAHESTDLPISSSSRNGLDPSLESPERLRLALESSSDGIWDWDLQRDTFYVSAPWCQKLGLKPDEIPGGLFFWESIIHPDDKTTALKLLRRHLRGESPYFHADTRVKNKNGDWIWVSTRGKVVERDSSGQARRVVGTQTNIRRQKIVEEDNFRMIFERSSDAYLLFDDTEMIDCNAATLHMLGYRQKDEVMRRPLLFHSSELQPDGRKSEEKFPEMEAIARAKGFHRFEWTYKKTDGTEFPVEVTLNRVTINGHDLSLMTWHDLTEQRESQARITQSSKLASLGEMAGGLAHEINNPLTIIKTKAEQITLKLEREKSIDPAWLMEKIKVVDQTVDRIAKIIKGLKSFARDSRFDPMDSCDLRAVIEDTLSLCSARFMSHNIDLSVKVPKTALQLECRSVQLAQVFLNLLNNAFDAVQESSRPWVRIEAREDKVSFEISITDSGPGVEKSLRSKIMHPFFTTKEIGKGTGLGLSISRGIVEAHGGKLFLDEDSPHTRFVVSLPKEPKKS